MTLYCGSLGHGMTLSDTVVWRRGTLGDTGCAPSVKFASSLYMSFCFGGDSPYDKDKFQTSITPGIDISLFSSLSKRTFSHILYESKMYLKSKEGTHIFNLLLCIFMFVWV